MGHKAIADCVSFALSYVLVFLLGGFVWFRGGVKAFEKAVTRLIDELGDSDD
jgi:hypothetical protein